MGRADRRRGARPWARRCRPPRTSALEVGRGRDGGRGRPGGRASGRRRPRADRVPRLAALVEEEQAAGRTAVVVAVDGRPVGVLALADRVRPGAAAAVAALSEPHRHRDPVLLTGDNPRAAAALAAPGRDRRRTGRAAARRTRWTRYGSWRQTGTGCCWSATVSTTPRRWPPPTSVWPWAASVPTSRCPAADAVDRPRRPGHRCPRVDRAVPARPTAGRAEPGDRRGRHRRPRRLGPDRRAAAAARRRGPRGVDDPGRPQRAAAAPAGRVDLRAGRRATDGRAHRHLRLELRPLGRRALPAAARRLGSGWTPTRAVPHRRGQQQLLPLAEGRGLRRPGAPAARRASSSRSRRRGG